MDSVHFTDSGTIIVVIDDQTSTLRRPKIGELKAFDESWQSIVDVQTDRNQKVVDGEQPEPFDFAPLFMAWYRQVFDALSDVPLPESDDDLPSWFAAAEAGNEWRPRWKAVPWVAGAKPSEQDATAQQAQLAQMAATVTRLEPLIPLLQSAISARTTPS